MDQLRAAEQSFREASKVDPGFAAPYYDLGELLLHRNRGSDAAAAFKDFVRVSADDPTLIRDMPVQRLRRAPDFTAVDSNGKTISSGLLRGRVVLLDFWATWCPPCLRALPVMRELSHYSPSDLSLISIDEDSPDAQVWKEFISKQNMDSTQVWDQEAALYHTFGLGAPTELSLPRYILIDREGYVLRVYGGTDRLGSVAGHAIRLARRGETPDHATAR
jgi:peroxiredoxin